jgi:hypothetical protein
MDSIEDRQKRYSVAQNRAVLWRGLLEEAYQYALPTRDDFTNQSVGQNRMHQVWDSTALSGVQSFASNLQYLLMPPFQRWMQFVPGPQFEIIARQRNISEQGIKQELAFLTEVFFQYLDQSNFSLAVNEALQDMSISMGVMLLNEGPTTDNPLIFSAIPISQIAIEEGADGNIQNYWHSMKIAARLIKEKWRDVQLTDALQTLLTHSPDQEIELIQGMIYYPEAPDSTKPYYYYVCEVATKTEIVQRWMNYSPWLGFRLANPPEKYLGAVLS